MKSRLTGATNYFFGLNVSGRRRFLFVCVLALFKSGNVS